MDFGKSGQRGFMRTIVDAEPAEVVFYRVPWDTPMYTKPTPFRFSIYNDPFPENSGIGWQDAGRDPPDCCGRGWEWYDGHEPAPMLNTGPCGTDAVAERGAIAGVDPIFQTNGIGQPPCCAPGPAFAGRGGQWESGSASFGPTLTRVGWGGQWEGGTAEFARPVVFAGQGGQVEGGTAVELLVHHFAGQGGQREGGTAQQLRPVVFAGQGGQREGGRANQLKPAIMIGTGGQWEGGKGRLWTRLQGWGGQVEGGTADIGRRPGMVGTGGQREGGTASMTNPHVYIGSGGQREGGSAIIFRSHWLPGTGGQREGGSGKFPRHVVYIGSGGQREGGRAEIIGGKKLIGSGGQREGGTGWKGGGDMVGAGGQREGGSARWRINSYTGWGGQWEGGSADWSGGPSPACPVNGTIVTFTTSYGGDGFSGIWAGQFGFSFTIGGQPVTATFFCTMPLGPTLGNISDPQVYFTLISWGGGGWTFEVRHFTLPDVVNVSLSF